jgi:aspartokinase/homoserine dehydrogenase 1
LRLVALCDSRRLWTNGAGIAARDWRRRFEEQAGPADLDRLTRTLLAASGRRVVLDLTASETVAARYPRWLAQGIDVVAANKIAAAAPGGGHRVLAEAAARGATRYLGSATVGAGLPVLSTLERLRDSGDRVRSIRGILSGSLGFVALRVQHGAAFSVALAEARARGLTEPDPRQDLSGLDVARKLVIAGRAAGIDAELGAIELEDLVPLALRGGDAAAFCARSTELDAPFGARRAQAEAQGAVLRPVGRIDADGRGSIGFEAVSADDPLARLRPGDNCVEISTDRYRDNPLVIRGAGAGREVTAGAVLADLFGLAGLAAPELGPAQAAAG